ncbi:hypothetical protein U1Q18_032037, partial [Sarracenia purpurea var. burkii]
MGKKISEVGVDDLVKAGLAAAEAKVVERGLKDAIARTGGGHGLDPRELWRDLTARRLLRPSHPHSVHQLVYYAVYADYDALANGPPPHWFPSLYLLNSYLPSHLPHTIHSIIIEPGFSPATDT